MKVATTTNTPQTFSSSSATPTSSIQQPKTVFGVKTSLAGGGEFLNAKIIGVRNVANAKVKGTSSLSLMNASNLNIAHIGGKQVIIANNSTLGANQSVVGNSTRINSNTSSIVPNTNTMLLSANNNCSNLVIEQQCLKDKVFKVHTETYATEREGSSTVSGLSEQTVMLRTQLVKAKSVQPTAGTRLTNQRCNTTFPTENSGTVNEIKNTARLAAQGSVTVQQQHQQQQRPDHNINTGGINAPSTSNVGMVTTVVTPMMSKSIVIQPTSSGNINSNTKVTEIGLPKTQSQRVVLSQPIIIPSSLQTSSSISLKRLKVIPINKQCKK
ncbi:uncharacterized protein LOC128729515 [Anopheles nili]|uniref:uncharacterized protein LOC128729515 n=1 Tax=Anopheles nili TaxID=185578 RepID=UPI00237C2B96|nr:uncharacterized protein LOC128729515 [Anopheles nili]